MYLLARIFALKQLSIDSSACYETGYFTSGAKDLIIESMKVLVRELRPHMIPLVELQTHELADMSYLSAIGNQYGDIYERQLELAINSRMNQKPKVDWWDSLVKPII